MNELNKFLLYIDIILYSLTQVKKGNNAKKIIFIFRIVFFVQFLYTFC